MFRRKEEGSMFGNDSTQAQATLPASESATIVQPAGASSSAGSAGAQASVAVSATGNSSAPASNNSNGVASNIAASAPAAVSRPAIPEASRPAAQPASAFRPASPASMSPDFNRPRPPEARPNAVNMQAAATVADKSTGSKGVRRVLTVGSDILLKGEIATCDRLVIEGKVDATLNDVHTVEIAESGSFKGTAHIEDAEISGLFEGELVVRNRLVIYASGKVCGKITYGEIEIERGGELTGEIKTVAQAQPSSRSSGSASGSAARKDDKVAA